MIEPWESEGDRKEWTAHGLKCLILRHPSAKHLCGYVGVPVGHPYHGLSEDWADGEPHWPDLDVHGGVTWTGELPHDGSPDDPLWYIGFDCAHSGDLSPGWLLEFPRHIEPMYWDMELVTEQTENLARQLAEATDANRT